MGKPEVTRKPYSISELGRRWGIGLARPWDDDLGNVTVGMSNMAFHKEEREAYFTYMSYGTIVALMSENLLTAWVVNKTYSPMTSSHVQAARSGLYRGGFEATGKAVWREDMCQNRYYRTTDRNIEYTEYKRSAADRGVSMYLFAEETKKQTRKRAYVPINDRPASQPIRWYKILDKNGCAMHGGTHTYSLPELDEETGIWTPGYWEQVIDTVDLCWSGYHVTEWPQKWFPDKYRHHITGQVEFRIFEVEVKGDYRYDAHDHKVAFQSIRLIRELTYYEAKAIGPRRTVYKDKILDEYITVA